MDKISIIIADDHPIVLQGIQSYVSSLEQYTVMDTFNNGIKCLNCVLLNKPDLAILDVNMPGLSGIEIISRAKKEGSKTKFVTLTLHKEESIYNSSIKAGTNGFLLKENALGELGLCIREVLKGKQYIGKGVLHNLITKEKRDPGILDNFTKTEKRIVKLIAQNKSSKEIANILFLSKKTIDNQRNNISRKLELNNKSMKLSDWVKAHISEII